MDINSVAYRLAIAVPRCRRGVTTAFVFLAMTAMYPGSSGVAVGQEVRVIAPNAPVPLQPELGSSAIANMAAGTLLEVAEDRGEWIVVYLPAEPGSARRVGYILSGNVEQFPQVETTDRAGHDVSETPSLPCDAWNTRAYFKVATVADVRRCLEQGAGVREEETWSGSTPLHYAAQYSTAEVVELLLSAGASADVNLETNEGFRPLHFAALSGSADVLRTIWDAGGSADARAKTDWGGYTPLHQAAGYSTAEVVELLLGAGASADVNLASNDGLRPLHFAAFSGSDDVFRAIWDAGGNADARAKSEQGYTPLHYAARYGTAAMIEVLLEAGADADVRAGTDDGWTPLHHGVRSGNAEVVEVLLSAGGRPDLNVETDEGWMPIHLAAESGSTNVFGSIVDAGARLDVRSRGEAGWTVLHSAARSGNAEIVDIVLRAGADARARTDFAVSPLHLAVRYGDVQMVQALLSAGAGADLGTTTYITTEGRIYDGNTPFALAYASGSEGLVELLLAHGADPIGRQGESICGEEPDTQLLLVVTPNANPASRTWGAGATEYGQGFVTETDAVMFLTTGVNPELIAEKLGFVYNITKISDESFWRMVKPQLQSCSARVGYQTGTFPARVYVLPFKMRENLQRHTGILHDGWPTDGVRPLLR